jgi:hypothetical protein
MPRTWDHAIVTKRIINLGRLDPGPVPCSYPPCENLATSLYQHVICEHSPRLSCSAVDQGAGGRHYRYTFCRQRCKNHFVSEMGHNAQVVAERNAGRIGGNLLPGYR